MSARVGQDSQDCPRMAALGIRIWIDSATIGQAIGYVLGSGVSQIDTGDVLAGAVIPSGIRGISD